MLGWTDLRSYGTRAVLTSVTDGLCSSSGHTREQSGEGVCCHGLTMGTGFPGGAMVENPASAGGEKTQF